MGREIILKKIVSVIVLLNICLLSFGQDYLLESFDGTTFPPNGWSQAQVSGTGLWNRSTSGFNPTCSPQSGEGMARFNSYNFPAGTSAVLISNNVDLSETSGLKLQIWIFRDNGSLTKLDAIDLYINTTSSLSGAQHLGTRYRPISAEPAVAANGWYKYNFDIPSSYNGSNNFILIKGTSDGGRNIFIDDVRVYKPITANSPPINFSTSSITQTSMTIHWEDNSTNELGFRVYVSSDGINYNKYGEDIISSTQEQTGDSYSKIITNLLPGTTYYFRVTAYVDGESDFLVGYEETLPADIILSVASGNWNSTTTWSTGTVPTSTDNVQIEEGHTVTLNANGSFNELAVNGELSFQAFTLNGKSVTVSETGKVIVSAGTSANLSLFGNLINNGELNFYVSDALLGRITFTGSSSQTFHANSITNIGNITVNKGSSFANTIELIANGTFSIKSGSGASFLTLTNGTLKISGDAPVSSIVFPSGGYTIFPSSGLWLNNPNFQVLGTTSSATVNGYLRISAGSYGIGNSSIFNLNAGAGSTITIDGGTLNVGSRFYTENAINFNLTSGSVNVSVFGNASSSASFGLVSSSNNINITGGSINLVQRNTGTTPLDYNLAGSTLNITGGTLNIGTGATASNFDFRIRGITPSIAIDNTNNAKTALLTAETNVLGNITVTDGSTLNTQTSNLNLIGNSSQTGNIINNGLITNTSATGSNRFNFVGEHGAQTLSGNGTFGNSTTPFAGIVFSNASGVSVESAIVTNRVNLISGLVTGANNITMGNGGTSSPVVQRGGFSAVSAGSFDQSPIFNPGTSYSVTYSSSNEPITTGFELPSLLTGTLELATNLDITLNASTSVQKLTLASTNAGNLITSSSNLLTVNGSLANDITIVSGNTGYVKGPLARVLPPSLSSGATYLFPIGKGEVNNFDLVSPTTSSGGVVMVTSEVFDEHPGGTDGPLIQDGSLGNRYWRTQITSGEANFINTYVRVTQNNPALIPGNALAQSETQAGEFNSISSTLPVSNSIISDQISNLGYFAIGLQEQTLGGVVYGGSNICYGETSELLTLSGYIGTIIRWESSVSPFTDWTTIAHTDPTYTSEALSETTRFRAVVKSGSFDEEASEYTEVDVSPITIGGEVLGGSTICEGSTSELLTLSNYTGTILRWESSTSPFTEWINIEHTEENYISNALFETTLFRAVVQSGVCDVEESEFTEVVVTPTPNPIISTIDNLAYCVDEEISVSFTIGIEGDDYQWLLNGEDILGATLNTYNATSTGTYSVIVTIDGCPGISNEIEIIEKPTPNPTILTEDDLFICGDDEINIEFSINIIGDSYQWLLNGVAIDDATNSSYLATQAGVYSVEVTIDGCSGISNELEIVVNPIPEPFISSLDELEYCEGSEINVLFTINISGNSYQWLLNGIAIESATSETYIADQAGIYSVEVTTLGCTGVSNEIEVIVNPLPTPTISASGATEFCEGEDISVELTIDIAGDSYQWLLNSIAIDLATSNTYTATQEGVYSVEVTSIGCAGISNVIEVVLKPTPVPVISTNDQLEWFEGEDISVTFTADITDADSYQWYVNDQPIDNAISSSYQAIAGGTYYVDVTVNNCNGVSNSITVVVNPVPTFTVTFSVTNSNSEPIENAEIVIEDLEPIFTIADGTASINLANGVYSFVVMADSYQVFSDEFEVEDVDFTIPIQLIGVGVERFQLSSLRIYPNPFSNHISISTPELVQRIVFTNLIGQVVMDVKPNGEETIITSGLARGVYLVKIFGNNGEQVVRKIIKE